MINIGKTDDGIYTCNSCGHWWKAKRILKWWPVRVMRGTNFGWRITRHYVEIGSMNIGQPVLQQVFSFGPLRFVLGPDKFVSPIAVHTFDGQTFFAIPQWQLDQFRDRQRRKEMEIVEK